MTEASSSLFFSPFAEKKNTRIHVAYSNRFLPSLLSQSRRRFRFPLVKDPPSLMVMIVDFNCEKLLTKGYCVYVFFDLHLFGFHEKYVFHKATVQFTRFKILISHLKNIEMY